MKKKKKIAVRRRWQINPVTRRKESDKTYSREKAKRDAQKNLQDEREEN